jgi:heat shock protein HspQ
LNSKWKKLIIGAVLLIGFVLFTQYKKSAEPAWKVNAENFQVINNWDELMKLEEKKYYELKFATRFQILKDANKSIPLLNENRTLRIEKTWNHGHQLYILYSVDLLERDKSETEIPKLRVDRVKLTSKDGEDFETRAELVEGDTGSESYVYKHRLYRSLMIYPQFENIHQNDWEKISGSERLELTSVSMNSSKGKIVLDSIAFKIKPINRDLLDETIASTSVNQNLTLYDGNEIKVNELEFFQIGTRLTVDQNIHENIIGFSGVIKDNESGFPISYEITEDKNGNTIIQSYSIMDHLLMMDKSDTSEFTISQSIHQTEGIYQFFVSKKEIEEITKNPENEILKNETVVNKEGVKVIYRGLSFDKINNQLGIKFTMENSEVPIENYLIYPKPSYHFQDMDEIEHNKSYMSNLISVKNAEGKPLEDYNIDNIFNDEYTEYMISFYNGSPKEDITITLSNLTRIEPIENEIKVPIKFPESTK